MKKLIISTLYEHHPLKCTVAYMKLRLILKLNKISNIKIYLPLLLTISIFKISICTVQSSKAVQIQKRGYSPCIVKNNLPFS